MASPGQPLNLLLALITHSLDRYQRAAREAQKGWRRDVTVTAWMTS